MCIYIAQKKVIFFYFYIVDFINIITRDTILIPVKKFNFKYNFIEI